MRLVLSRFTPLCVMALCVFAACGPGELRWIEEEGHRWAELPNPMGRGLGFTALDATETGLSFANDISPELAVENQMLTHGSGVTLGDVDGDGRPDVFLGRIEGSNALYRNVGGMEFEDITEQAGVALADRHTTGSAFLDFDGDGDLDLLLAAKAGANSLFLNDGLGQFTDASSQVGFMAGGGSTTIAAADVEGDGDLDVYVSNYKARKASDIFAPQERSLDQIVRTLGDGVEVVEKFRDHYRIEDTPEGLRQWEFGEPDMFYTNEGGQRLEPVDFTGGRFLEADGTPLDRVPDEWGLTARFHDLNGDGHPELYVSNDFESPDHFWINQGDGSFIAADPITVRNTSASSMAVDFSDLDRDGQTDFMVMDMLARRGAPERRRQMPTMVPEPVRPGEPPSIRQHNRNTLFLGRGDGTYAEVALAAGVEASDWSWAIEFVDVDLDGYEDALVATGHMWDVLDADAQITLLNTRVTSDWRNVINQFPPLRLGNVAFRNRGDGTFEDVSDAWGFAIGRDMSHGIASADLDGDGDLDVVLNRLNDPVALLRNDSEAERIAVRLRGAGLNTRGVGALIEVTGGPVSQSKEVTVGGHYLSSSDQTYAFAAGAEDMRITVTWRDGAVSVVDSARAGRIYEVDQAASTPGGDRRAAAEPESSFTTPLFEDVSDRLDHTHVDEPFNDFARQPLIGYRMSQLGPGLSWTDADGDGDPDLVVGSGAGGFPTLLRNEGSTFSAETIELESSDYDQSSVLPLPSGEQGTALLIARSSHESETADEAETVASAVLVSPNGAAAGPDPGAQQHGSDGRG